MSGPGFACWLIGADSLLTECGEVLLQRGHEIRGVITATPRIAQWAASRNLGVLDPKADVAGELARRPFEHLFAITHLALLPPAWLALPQRGAINFHDGPLPDYAGLNTPAWALIAGETRYGITWHAMTAGVDEGEILSQVLFDIDPDETALSLNTKCFETALESFGPLVDALAQGSVRPQPQEPGRRRYFERYRRPRAAAVLDWSRPATELEALVRGLDFGRYANPLGSAKLRHGGRAAIVARARSRPGEGSQRPGTLLAADESGLLVATSQGQLLLSAFTELSGRPLEPLELVRRFGLSAGDVLDALTPDEAQQLGALDARIARSESFWAKRLAQLDPMTLPLRVAARLDEHGVKSAALDVPLPPALAAARADAAHAGGSLPAVLTAAFAVYLARLGRRSRFDLGFTDAALQREAAGRTDLLASRVPLRIEVALERPLSELAERLAAELPALSRRGPWLRDSIARHPELHALHEDSDAQLLPVSVRCGGRFDSAALPIGAECTLEIDVEGGRCRLLYAADRIAAADAASFAAGFAALLDDLARHPAHPANRLTLVAPAERQLQIVDWNRTARPHRRDVTLHALFEEQARRTPSAVALVSGERSLSYAELDARAEALAAELSARGVRRGSLVGLCVERSPEQVIAILATLKAGGAYLPLDPAFPADRLAFMIEDSQVGVIVVDARHAARLAAHGATLVPIQAAPQPTHAAPAAHGDPATVGVGADTTRAAGSGPSDLAYVIYTSGSTGRPKGVLVEHRNVASFFAAIDERIPHDPPGTWLAVTSLSFDISVLELLWTLTRGFKVVLPTVAERAGAAEGTGAIASASSSSAAGAAVGVASGPGRARESARPEFSLFYFSSDEGQDRKDGYRLLLEGARFADTHGFSAVWTPERHFHAFGGLYPNPAVAGAAIAAITQRVAIRAGSVVLPLHHPVRVAEDWSLVDNLSNGRVGISFASGWHPNDFVLAPQNKADAKALMLRNIEVVRRLWRGESVGFPGADGVEIPTATLPRPVQPELPVWITSAGNPDTYIAAGRAGANVLTHLLGQSIEQLQPKIAAYRQARAAAGHDPATGVVTLMLHTFVGEDEAVVEQRVREPLERYLGSSLSLLKDHGWAFPAFRRPGADAAGAAEAPAADELAQLLPDERAALLAAARERYYGTSGLFGTPERCLELIERVRAIGVDEIACLIDFGIPADDVLASLPLLDRVRVAAQQRAAAPVRPDARGAAHEAPSEVPLAQHLRTQGVTHLQCTPSMARMLCSDPDSRAALGGVRHLFVGGEALPSELANELAAATGGSVTNMYGPTETTIWSSTHPTSQGADHGHGGRNGLGPHLGPSIGPIGRPIANTSFYVLDESLAPLPIGASGELFIGGDGVARGYLRRPELDRERFLPDPFSSTPGARMYRTGDLVRCRADGVFEFLGRTDQQIKLRGHRIEPGEIEALLSQQPSVAEAVVVAHEDSPGDQRLVAYIVPRGPADTERLRERLAATLPDYMVPTRVVALERIPRTPNGKLDRRALAASRPAGAAGAAACAAAELAAPVGELESRLVKLWCETLGLERVGVDSNFFDLGGHSLLIVRILRRMGEVTTRRVGLTDLFRFPTIRSLARFLVSTEEHNVLDEATQRGRRRRAFLNPRQRLRGN